MGRLRLPMWNNNDGAGRLGDDMMADRAQQRAHDQKVRFGYLVEQHLCAVPLEGGAGDLHRLLGAARVMFVGVADRLVQDPGGQCGRVGLDVLRGVTGRLGRDARAAKAPSESAAHAV